MQISCRHLYRLVEPGPLGGTLVRDRATRCLPDEARIFGKRTCPMAWRPWFPCSAPLCKFDVVHQDIHPTFCCIDLDTVAIAYQRQRATHKRLRRDIANAHAARGT